MAYGGNKSVNNDSLTITTRGTGRPLSRCCTLCMVSSFQLEAIVTYEMDIITKEEAGAVYVTVLDHSRVSTALTCQLMMEDKLQFTFIFYSLGGAAKLHDFVSYMEQHLESEE